MNTKDKGNITELKVMTRLAELGHTVSVPFGENARYDLIWDDDGQLKRVQCKTGRLRNGVIRFNTCSRDKRDFLKKKSYDNEVECFGVYCGDNDTVYVVPVDDAPSAEGTLRVLAAKNGQSSGVRMAKDYEL